MACAHATEGVKLYGESDCHERVFFKIVAFAATTKISRFLVNGLDPQILPGSFLYKKEPGYKASFSPLFHFCYKHKQKVKMRRLRNEDTVSPENLAGN